MKSVRTVFRLVGAVWLVAVIAIGIGGTYLQNDPEAAAVYALGTMNVDRDANLIDQAGQLAEGMSAAHEGVTALGELERANAAAGSRAEARRKYEEARAAGWGHEAAARSAGLPLTAENGVSVE